MKSVSEYQALARSLKGEGFSHQQALLHIARSEGFRDWGALRRAAGHQPREEDVGRLRRQLQELPFLVAGYLPDGTPIRMRLWMKDDDAFVPASVKVDGVSEVEMQALIAHQLKYASLPGVIVDDPTGEIAEQTAAWRAVAGPVEHLNGVHGVMRLIATFLCSDSERWANPKDLHHFVMEPDDADRDETGDVIRYRSWLTNIWRTLLKAAGSEPDPIVFLQDILHLDAEGLLTAVRQNVPANKRWEFEIQRDYQWEEYLVAYEVLTHLRCEEPVLPFDVEVLDRPSTVYLGPCADPVAELLFRLLFRAFAHAHDPYPSWKAPMALCMTVREPPELRREFYNGWLGKYGLVFYARCEKDTNYHYQHISRTAGGVFAYTVEENGPRAFKGNLKFDALEERR